MTMSKCWGFVILAAVVGFIFGALLLSAAPSQEELKDVNNKIKRLEKEQLGMKRVSVEKPNFAVVIPADGYLAVNGPSGNNIVIVEPQKLYFGEDGMAVLNIRIY